MREFLETTFPNFKGEMYDGNMPAGKGHERVDGGYMDRWVTKYGGGESYDDVISNAQFSINYKISINIIGNYLQIVDFRYDGKTDIWEYTNIPDRNIAWCVLKKHYHVLEPDRIEKILNTKIENCKFWDMVQARAKELYALGIIEGVDNDG